MTVPILPLPDSTTQHVDDSGKPKKDFTNWLKSVQDFVGSPSKIKASLGLATVATTGAYSDLTGTPAPYSPPAAVAFNVNKNGTNQTGIADSTPTVITWPTKQYDVGSHFA